MIRILFSIIILSLFSCENERGKILLEDDYIYIKNRDTSKLHIQLFKDRFHGQLIHTKPGGYIVTGEINGKIVNDTLIGENHYLPYKWADKKVGPIVLLKKGNTFIQGSGSVSILLGIPHFTPGTLSFDNPIAVYTVQ